MNFEKAVYKIESAVIEQAKVALTSPTTTTQSGFSFIWIVSPFTFALYS